MGSSSTSLDTNWWVFTLPAIAITHNSFLNNIIYLLVIALLSIGLLSWAFPTAGGVAWRNGRNKLGRVPIPGPKGVPILGSLFTLSNGLPHRTLASMASTLSATQLMAFSLGSTPAVITSNAHMAREILNSPYFADRPIKESAKSLMFARAIGFAQNGAYWRSLRRLASTHLFSPRRISAHEPGRRNDCAAMLRAVAREQSQNGVVCLRKHLQDAALNNVMGTVFGRRYDNKEGEGCEEVMEVREMVREGFELLGAFNLCDYVSWLGVLYDPLRIRERCEGLTHRVRKFVKKVVDEHRVGPFKEVFDGSDFVDVLLSVEGDEKLQDDDMIAVLWEMIFRGTDTTALVTEWVMAELVINQGVQARLRNELQHVIRHKRNDDITDDDVAKLPYLEAIVKETLRLHPVGPLLSWARLSTSDVQLSNGMVVPANTTTMVNMWAITHDPSVWEDPLVFKPERFLKGEGGVDFDVRGVDLRLAPFGAGRRVCPGRNLGLVTVTLWVAKLVQKFQWFQHTADPVDLTELLKLSCEMKNPLKAVAVPTEIA